MKPLLYICIAMTVYSCSPPKSDDIDSDDCIDNMITILDMEHYSGVMDDDCNDYLRWFTHDGSDYFMLDNPCADLALHLWNCEKVDICSENTDECQIILTNMTAQGIVGRN